MCRRLVSLGSSCLLKTGPYSHLTKRSMSAIHSDPHRPIEEERYALYDPKTVYPARIGETLGGRYKLISKLGWGTGSTVWLAGRNSRWPWRRRSLVALKIANSSPVCHKAAQMEVDVSDRIQSMWSTHQGEEYIRQALDSFEVDGPGGKHICIAFEPLRQPLWLFGRQYSTGVLPPLVVKVLLPSILKGLDFLHSECHLIHTDLKGGHFMMPFEDKVVLQNYADEQERNPAVPVERQGRPVYESRRDFGRLKKGVGYLKLTDLGLAARGDLPTKNNHDIQPLEYTAPEVILKTGWTYSADIWNLGLVLWDLLGEGNLIDGRVSERPEFSYPTLFAQMIRLLGPPPPELVQNADGEIYSRLFDDQGAFRYPELIPGPELSFEARTPMLEGREKTMFINFAKRMLAWMPEERASAAELLSDPWLKVERAV